MEAGTRIPQPDSEPSRGLNLIVVNTNKDEGIANNTVEEIRENDVPGIEHGTQETQLLVSNGPSKAEEPQVTEEEEEVQFFAAGMAAPEVFSDDGDERCELPKENAKEVQINLQEVRRNPALPTYKSENEYVLAEKYRLINDQDLSVTATRAAITKLNKWWEERQKYWHNIERQKINGTAMKRSGDIDYG